MLHLVYAFLLTFVLTTFSSLSFADSATRILLDRLHYQKGQKNYFQVGQILDKLKKIDQSLPEIHEEQIVYLIETEAYELAERSLFKASRILPEKRYQEIKVLLDIHQHNKPKLIEARLLYKRQLYKDSLALYADIFEGKKPYYSLLLEYWDVYVAVYPKKRGKVTVELEKLAATYPKNAHVQLYYYKYKLRSDPYNRAIYRYLEYLISNNVWSVEAIRIWSVGLKLLTLSNDNADIFRTYIKLNPSDNIIANKYKKEIAKIRRHERLLSTKEYQAKIKAIELINKKSSAKAIYPHLNLALTKFSNDQDLVIAQGFFYLRQGNHTKAKSFFRTCINKNFERRSVCESLNKTTGFWELIKKYKLALADNNIESANGLLKTLLKHPDIGNWKFIAQALMYRTLEQPKLAEQQYQALLTIDPLNKQALNGIMALKEQDSFASLKKWYFQLTKNQKNIIKSEFLRKDNGHVREIAKNLVENQKITDAETVLTNQISFSSHAGDPAAWLRYDLAILYLNNHNQEDAMRIFSFDYPLASYRHAKSLILYKTKQYEALVEMIDRLPINKTLFNIKINAEFQIQSKAFYAMPSQIKALTMFDAFSIYERFELPLSKILANVGLNKKAQKIIEESEQGSETQAQVLLLKLYVDNEQYQQALTLLNELKQQSILSVSEQLDVLVIKIKLAELGMLTESTWNSVNNELDEIPVQNDYRYWRLKLDIATYKNDQNGVLGSIDNLLELNPNTHYLWRRKLLMVEQELPISRGNYKSAVLLPYIEKFPYDPMAYDVAQKEFYQLDELKLSEKQLTHKGYIASLIQLFIQDNQLPLSLDVTALEMKEVIDSRQLSDEKNSQLALLLQQFERAEIVNTNNINNTNLASSNWMLNRFKRKIAERQRYQQRLELLVAKDGKEGRSGVSDYQQETIQLKYAQPFFSKALGQGEWFFLAENLNADAGVINANDASNIGSLPGCELECNLLTPTQKQNGTAFSAGINTATIDADLGWVAVGFNEKSWVGGIKWRTSAGPLGLTLGLKRRPVSGSLLSIAGIKDPYSGINMGGAKLNQASATFSYFNKNWGAWLLTDIGVITAENSPDNQRVRMLAGVYNTFYESELLSFSAGLNAYTWKFEHNLSRYTLGHAGYYSPQAYKALALPFDFHGRMNDFSYQVRFGVSLSESETEAQPFYPIPSRLPESVNLEQAQQLTYEASKGDNLSYSAQFLAEYKINSHWSVGAQINLQRSEFYQPNSAKLYVRYYFDDNYLRVNTPPIPVESYLDY